jgi:hypothetical protein
MRIGDDHIRIDMGGVFARLRPSLRCTWRLERRYGFGPLARAIVDGNLGIMADVILEASDQDLDQQVIGVALAHNLKDLDSIAAQLLALLCTMCGGDDEPDDQHQHQNDAKPVPLSAFYMKLFRIGTGWLGWTPADTWHATPNEILEAYKGRVELLQAVFGGGTDTETEPDPDAPLDRQGLEDLRSLGSL